MAMPAGEPGPFGGDGPEGADDYQARGAGGASAPGTATTVGGRRP